MKKKLCFIIYGFACILLVIGKTFGAPPPATHCVESGESLQSVLTAAQTNSEGDLIKVARGTYTGNFYYNSPQTYSLILRGGYAPGCASRILNPTNTILDGGESGRVLFLNSSGSITVEGFTIQNGTFVDNGAGIAAISYSGSGAGQGISIESNIITGNTVTDSSEYGGGIYAHSGGLTGSGIISISDNIVTNNIAGYGGGIYIKSATTTGTMNSTYIARNTCSGNTSYKHGGGIYVKSLSTDGVSSSNITLEHNTVTENTTTTSGAYYGGGIYIDSSGETGSGSITLEDNTCADNTTAGEGGGIHASTFSSAETAGAITLMGNIITSNTASANGGMYSSSGSFSGTGGEIVLVNNIICGNTCSGSFGGTYLGSFSSLGVSNAITLTNNTIYGNFSSDYGGATLNTDDNYIYAYNNIIYDNSSPDIAITGGTGYGYNNNSGSLYIWSGGSGNINVDPKFAGSGDYHLKPTSPCINAGLNSAPEIPDYDFEGDPRIRNNTVDIGADEALKAAITSLFYLLILN